VSLTHGARANRQGSDFPIRISRQRAASWNGLAIRKAPSGIIIPDTAQEKPQQGKVTAAKLPDQIASVFLLLALFGKQIDYLLSV
jgi:hypothetical protein